MRIVKIKLEKDGPLHIPVVGDIQLGNEGFVESKLRRFLEKTKKYSAEKKSSTWFIDTGDNIDFMSPSNRAAYRASGIYSSSKRLIDCNVTLELVQKLYKLMPETHGRTAVICRGHHWSEFDWGGLDVSKRYERLGLKPKEHEMPVDSDHYLAELLGATYSPAASLVSFRWPSGVRFRVLAMHGEGSGRTMPYMVNKLVRFCGGWEGVDAVVAGHTHQLVGAFDPKLDTNEDETEIVDRNVALVNSGSCLAGYLVDDVAYPEAKQLPPLALGYPVLSAEPYKNGKRWRFDVTVHLHA